MPSITADYKGEAGFESRVGDHMLVFDRPSEVFVASIAACIAAVVAHYCRSASLNPEGLSVEVSYDLAHDPFRLINFKAVVRLPHCDPGKRAKSIVRVARKCPVYRAIVDTTSEIDVTLETQATRQAE